MKGISGNRDELRHESPRSFTPSLPVVSEQGPSKSLGSRTLRLQVAVLLGRTNLGLVTDTLVSSFKALMSTRSQQRRWAWRAPGHLPVAVVASFRTAGLQNIHWAFSPFLASSTSHSGRRELHRGLL